MICKRIVPVLTLLFLFTANAQGQGVQPTKSSPGNLITAEELKLKLDRNEPLTIIDLRANSSYVASDHKIKGAIHVKLRKLQYRLGFFPFKDLPRDREVITYCACPSDEASVRAAEILGNAGFTRVRVLKGGWQAWMQVRGPVESRPRGM